MTKTLKQAINTYGADMQLNVAIEEMAELTKELCKFKRGAENIENITEELADCYVMFEQLKIIFDIEDLDVQKIAIKKIVRLEERLKNESH